MMPIATASPTAHHATLESWYRDHFTDRRAVQITGDLSGGRVGYDDSGAVITARSGDHRLSIDGRVIREDVLDVAL